MNLLIPFLTLAALLLYKKKTDAKKFIQNVKILDFNLAFDLPKTLQSLGTTLYFKLNIKLQNITDFSQQLDSGFLNVLYNGNPLGAIKVTQQFTINPNGNTSVPLTLAIPSIKLFKSIQEAVAAVKGGKELAFQFKGEFDFPVGTYQVNESKKIKLV